MARCSFETANFSSPLCFDQLDRDPIVKHEVHASAAPVSYEEQNSTIVYHAKRRFNSPALTPTRGAHQRAALITGFKESSGHLTGEAEFKNRSKGYRITYDSGESRPTPHFASFFRRFPARDAVNLPSTAG